MHQEEEEEQPAMASLHRSRTLEAVGDAGIPIRFRTLSLTYDERIRKKATRSKINKAGPPAKIDPTTAIRDISAHLLRTDDVFTKFSTRRAKYGKNIISPPKSKMLRRALGYVFGGFNFMMWIAFVVTVISYQPLGSLQGGTPQILNVGVAVLIFVVIVLSSVFYAYVDWNASKIMNSIRSLVSDSAVVIRNGVQQQIPAADIVVGDLVVLSLGQRVPADIRLVGVSPDARFDRALLTGESDPVAASVDPTDENPLETLNLAFASTFLVSGSATGVCFAIGDDTVIGQIIGLSGQQKEQPTSIQKEINLFTYIISGLASFFFIVSVIFYQVYIQRVYPGFETLSSAILNAIGCLTAFVPQGLPVCVALSLTIVARRMAARKVLVKNLATIETLGCMSVLCSDKTGTLTAGQMSVQHIALADASVDFDARSAAESVGALKKHMAWPIVHRIAHLCNGATFDGNFSETSRIEDRAINGDSTDAAILRFAETVGAGSQLKAAGFETLFTIPFNSRNKWMATVVANRSLTSGEAELFVKRAPDILMTHCTSVMLCDGTEIPLTPEQVARVRDAQDRLSSNGQRVIALCRRSLPNMTDHDIAASRGQLSSALITSFMSRLTLVALVGMRDPPRADVPAAIATIRAAGVKVFMVTGDHQLTAQAIARSVGILSVGPERVDTLKSIGRSIVAASEVSASKASSSSVADLLDPPPLATIPTLKEIRAASKHSSTPRRSTATVSVDEIHALSLTGADLDTLDDVDWDVIAWRYNEVVFSRTSPEQKLRIVEMLKSRRDNTVAVTGDGVNDSPALRSADIGVAMGAGSDVAKEAAAMVLLNNDFASICFAIENGRLVFENLKKVTLYLMPAGTYTEFMAVLFNVFLGMQLPLSSYLQVFFSITHDVVMCTSLMFERPESDLMKRRPRNARRDRLTDWRFFVQIYLVIGLMMWPCAMGMWFLYFRDNGISPSSLIGAWNSFGYAGDTLAFVLANSPELTPANLTSPVYTDPSSPLFDSSLVGALSGQSKLLSLVNTGDCVYYVTMIFLQFDGLLATRTRRNSILQSNPFWGPNRNLFIPLGMLLSVILGIINVHGPAINSFFNTAPIPIKFWLLPLALGLAVLVVDEARKALVRAFPSSLIAYVSW